MCTASQCLLYNVIVSTCTFCTCKAWEKLWTHFAQSAKVYYLDFKLIHVFNSKLLISDWKLSFIKLIFSLRLARLLTETTFIWPSGHRTSIFTYLRINVTWSGQSDVGFFLPWHALSLHLIPKAIILITFFIFIRSTNNWSDNKIRSYGWRNRC